MNTTSSQTLLADYVDCCRFESIPVVDKQHAPLVFTIHAPRPFFKPVLELSQALSGQLAEVRETDREGTVQELLVHNRSNSYLLVYEGCLLKGAKQNRVVNATLLLPPLSETLIPASCVEQGRWRYASENFLKSPYDAPVFLRKSLRLQISKHATFKGDQSQVWKDVSQYSLKKQAFSSTSDFEEIYHQSDKSEKLFPSGLQLPPSTGIFVETKGECALDFVACEKAFAQLSPRLLAGYERSQHERPSTDLHNPAAFVARMIRTGTAFEQAAVGIGTDLRITSDQYLISALLLEGQVAAFGITTL